MTLVCWAISTSSFFAERYEPDTEFSAWVAPIQVGYEARRLLLLSNFPCS
jgi:hypothetical protein